MGEAAKGWTMDEVASILAEDLPEGALVNLGIGLPTLVADHLVAGREVILHAEHGLLGVGPLAPEGAEDWDLIDAGKRPVTLLDGAAVVHQADSFALVRGGHLDVAVLGAYEVSSSGDLANWSTGDPAMPPAVGGAMDLAAGAKAVWVIAKHLGRDGTAKIVERCNLPLTAAGVVRRIYTDYCVLEVDEDGLVVRRLAPDVEPAFLESVTGGPLRFPSPATAEPGGSELASSRPDGLGPDGGRR